MQNQIVAKDPWDYLRPAHVEMFGQDLLNPEKRARWCQALFYGGNTLRLWNEAIELKIALLSACALQEGQRVILIGKYADESGLAPALLSLLAPKGHLKVEEIAPQAFAGFSQIDPGAGKRMQWDFDHFDSLADESLDRVILFNAASHIGNWEHCTQQVNRTLHNGGRVVIAEAPLGGKDLETAANMDAHLEAFLMRILSGMGLRKEELPQCEPEALIALFKPILSWWRVFAWQGLYLFYGQKGGDEGNPSFVFPKSTEAVQMFLTEKSSSGPWEFLAAPEVAGLGREVEDRKLLKNWGRAIFFTDNLNWIWGNAVSIRHTMYSNLRAGPGNRALVIGEKLEALGFLPELRNRVGKEGEIAAFDMVAKSHSAYTKQWESGPDVFIPEKHRWAYPFADKYPDEHFDLVWLPQGVHHAMDWEETAQKLLRVLKPGGQVIMAECRTSPPEFFAGLKISGLLRCISEKIFWAMDTTFEEMPDYSTAHIGRAFGNSLTNTFSHEWKGILIFWGFKKE